MKNTYSKKMMKLRRRDPRFWGSVVLMGAGFLLLVLSPVLDGRMGGSQAVGISGAAASIVYYLPRVLLAVGLMIFFFFIRRVLDQKGRLEALTAEQLSLADQELNQSQPIAKGAPVYMTTHFLISGDYQFEVIPYEDMERTYYAGDLLVAVTADGKAHVVASGSGKKTWTGELEKELNDRISSCGAKRAAKAAAEKAAKAGAGKSAVGKNPAKKGRDSWAIETDETAAPDQPGSRSKAKKKAAQLRTLPKPDRCQALLGGLLLAVPGIAIWTLFCGFAIWGPLLGAMAIFFLISIGYGFGIRNLFVRHKDLGQWNPEEEARPVLILSFVMVVLACLLYHVLLLLIGYREFGYSLGYILGHFFGLLKQHGLWSLFRSRMLFGILTILILGFRFKKK